jgi:hypothetical protein
MKGGGPTKGRRFFGAPAKRWTRAERVQMEKLNG